MIKTENSHRTFFNLLAVAGILLSIIAVGCSTTVESQPQAAKAVESGGPMPASVTSFLGPDASKLAPGTKGGAALVWVSPIAQSATYNKILLDPVQFWAATDSKVSTSDQQILTEYFYNSLKTKIPQQGFATGGSTWVRGDPASGRAHGCDDHSYARLTHNLGGCTPGTRIESGSIYGHRQLRVRGIGGSRNESDRFSKWRTTRSGGRSARGRDGVERRDLFPVGRCSKRDGLLGPNDPAALEPVRVRHGGNGAESLSEPPVTSGCTV